jgi:ketosteroid isomerase-like protein
MSGLEVVKRYWSLMQSNDFRSVGQVLSDDFVLEWPQSNERIRGRDNLASMNEEYPAHGIWRFTVNKILGDEIDVVSDVSLTDGVQVARVISFFTVTDGKIRKMVEFWPDPFTAPDNRRHLVELMED